ncbi:MAG: repressor LexA, partial [Thermomicrobiales bacterium]|nr:repressor LexA [Thermomicrobiales bacterium]
MKPLSRRQQAILDFIEQFLEANDYPPTIRDIQSELSISSTSVVDYNLKVLEQRNLIRRNSKISRGIELVGRSNGRRNVVVIPVIGQIAAGLPIPAPGDLEGADSVETVELGGDLVPDGGRDLFALRVKGLSMVDALINDGDVVVLRQQETCENGETVAVWLKEQRET